VDGALSSRRRPLNARPVLQHSAAARGRTTSLPEDNIMRAPKPKQPDPLKRRGDARPTLAAAQRAAPSMELGLFKD
jgi:hypothetical protein